MQNHERAVLEGKLTAIDGRLERIEQAQLVDAAWRREFLQNHFSHVVEDVGALKENSKMMRWVVGGGFTASFLMWVTVLGVLLTR